MAWVELRLDTDADNSENLENALLAIGALAVTYSDAGDQPILEPGIGEMPLWSDIVLVALFDDDINTSEKMDDLQSQYSLELLNPRWNILEDRVWEREWLQYHQPVNFGERFWVYHDAVQDSAMPTLLLDPGLAFGTGNHPTTALCLDWIARQDWNQKTLIDYGCGSGILAIAAALLGCNRIICTDIDPQALQATLNNAQRNKIGDDQIKLYTAGNEPESLSDILVANILAGPLVELAENFAGKLKTSGEICLSGILASQENSILNAYNPWFEQLEVVNKDGWLRVTGLRKFRQSCE